MKPWEGVNRKRNTEQSIRNLLMDKEQDKIRWKDLMNVVSCSPATLSKTLKRMINAGEIRTSVDPNDRRVTFYEAVPVKIKTQTQLKEVETFLSKMKNPIAYETFSTSVPYILQKNEHGHQMMKAKWEILGVQYAFVDSPLSEDDIELNQFLHSIDNHFGDVFPSLSSLFAKLDKAVIVITFEKIPSWETMLASES